MESGRSLLTTYCCSRSLCSSLSISLGLVPLTLRRVSIVLDSEKFQRCHHPFSSPGEGRDAHSVLNDRWREGRTLSCLGSLFFYCILVLGIEQGLAHATPVS